MAGATSSEEAITSIKTLSQVLEARGFHLRKWRSNSPDVLSRISSNWVGNTSNLEIHPDECSKALGLTWNSVKDTFIFNLKVNFPDNITKRSFLSQSARLFDPLGFLTPCTVYIKIFYQQLWLLKLDWDSPLPDALATKWKTFRKEFEQICSIHIPRWIHTVSQQVTLHGFCDASELAYASVIYAVQPQADGIIKQTYWIIGIKKIVKKCIRKCIVCCRYRATTSKQLMGDPPAHRVTPSRPFSACGVDYAGPINVLRYRAKEQKKENYARLLDHFATFGFTRDTIVLIVLGSLGAWDPENDSFLKLVATKSYLNVLRKFSVSDCIRWIKDNYIQYLPGVKKFSAGEVTLHPDPQAI
ncbi:uncharacterized protein TNCT_487571 [Trichonephila clavata]|uniref:Uncharacterized protein n=1 Tax=Trichonephila clavata TaxID=2740835 RepID=A0A8X6HWF0_TRICU|nr:uncharacterized protein TNCT_487571 [Trichonephila clavata]